MYTLVPLCLLVLEASQTQFLELLIATPLLCSAVYISSNFFIIILSLGNRNPYLVSRDAVLLVEHCVQQNCCTNWAECTGSLSWLICHQPDSHFCSHLWCTDHKIHLSTCKWKCWVVVWPLWSILTHGTQHPHDWIKQLFWFCCMLGVFSSCIKEGISIVMIIA